MLRRQLRLRPHNDMDVDVLHVATAASVAAPTSTPTYASTFAIPTAAAATSSPSPPLRTDCGCLHSRVWIGLR